MIFLSCPGAAALGLSVVLAAPADASPRLRPPPAVKAVPAAVWRAAVEPAEEVRVQAAEAFAQGEEAYADGDFAGAIEHFRAAHELVPHPFTEYNLGLAYARADRTLDAWHTFDALARRADDPEHRADAEEQRAKLRDKVAMVRVDAPTASLVCVDGQRLPTGETRVVMPGQHRVQVDTTSTRLRLEGGETRHVDVRGSTVDAPTRPRPRSAVRPLLGVAIGAGVVAAGTGIGPLFTDDRNAELGLGLTAGAAATVAVVTSIAVLVLHSRRRKSAEPPARVTTSRCDP